MERQGCGRGGRVAHELARTGLVLDRQITTNPWKSRSRSGLEALAGMENLEGEHEYQQGGLQHRALRSRGGIGSGFEGRTGLQGKGFTGGGPSMYKASYLDELTGDNSMSIAYGARTGAVTDPRDHCKSAETGRQRGQG